MSNDYYNKVEKFVADSFTKEGKLSKGFKHFERTVHWVKELRPDADEALLIAAIGHDIERAYTDEEMGRLKQSRGFQDEEFLRKHSERGAKIVAEFLSSHNADSALIIRTKELISKHEVGGTEDQNLLKDADSLSFFENNIDHFITNLARETSKEKVKEKFDSGCMTGLH